MDPRAGASLAAAMALLAAGTAAAEPYQDRLLREHLFRQASSLPKGERPAVGLVLSAGGMRGLAHAGVIQVLENAGFPIDVVAGASAGAVVGALYAGGVTMGRFWGITDNLTFQTASDLGGIGLLRLILADRLASSEQMELFIKQQMGERRFEDLSKPFACVAMDIRTGESIIFRDGPVGPAVRASMNLPAIFRPVEYRHRLLVDGGVADYIPVDAARLLGAEWIIASVTEADYTAAPPSNVLTSLLQVIDIRGAILSRQQREQADVVIEPAVGDIEFYETKRTREAMEKGVLAAQKVLPRAQERFILRVLPRLLRGWLPAAPAGGP